MHMLHEFFEDLNDFCMTNQELGLVCVERVVEVGQRVVDEAQMVAAKVRGRHHTGFEGVEQNERPTRLLGMVERRMICDA